MIIEGVIYTLLTLLAACLYMLIRIIRTSHHDARVQEWQTYRKRAMNGLIFDDLWRPNLIMERQSEGFFVGNRPKPERMNFKEQPPSDLIKEDDPRCDIPVPPCVNITKPKVEVFN